jgi:redox-sensitive bicupin YhaK (pirin superfamily)
MIKMRRIAKLLKSRPTIEGAGVHLKRVFGFQQKPLFDPFLLMDDFHSDNPDHYLAGFPWHPHRGIETITYVLHGDVEHGDSMGNTGIIGSGDVQWMTAGNGIIHQEMPKGDAEGRMWGFQLWANLPASQKMMDPRYRDIKSADIPSVTNTEGVEINIICGNVWGTKGPVTDIVIEPQYLDITVPPETEFRFPVTMGHTVFAYVIEGAGYFDEGRDSYSYEIEGANYFDMERECRVRPETLVLYGDGDRIIIASGDQPLRFLLISGKPLNEPIAWYGPIVMNTEAELKQAFEEYRNGTFIRKK